ncbi:MAG: hypothetical protein R3A12_01135 [Ignavibacteria bacterium]
MRYFTVLLSLIISITLMGFTFAVMMNLTVPDSGQTGNGRSGIAGCYF